MPRAERAELTTVLTLQDQLSPGMTRATANISQTEAAVARIGNTANAAGANLGGLGTSLSQVAKAGVAAFGAFQALNIGADFLAGAIQGAQEEEASIGRLSRAVDENAGTWARDKQAIEDAITSRENLAFSDDDLRSSLTSLVAATHDVNKALEIQNTAMDLARFKGISLQEASQALVKVEAGRFRALADLGIQIKANASQEEALAAVQRVTAGQAQAFAQTTAGALQTVQIQLHDIQEEIGKEALPAVRDLALGFRDLANAARQAGPVVGSVLETLGLIKRGPSDEVKNLAERVQDLKAAGLDVIPVFDQFGNTVDVVVAGVDESTQATRLGAQAYDELHRTVSDTNTALINFNDTNARGAGIWGEFQANAEHGAEAVADVQLALDGLPKDVSITIDVGLSGAGAGVLTQGFPTTPGTPAGNTDFSPTAGSTANLGGTDADPAVVARKAEEARRKAQQAADQAAREARQRAEELARAYNEKVNRAFENAERTAKSLFDTLHERHLREIADTQKAAQVRHDAAIKAIDDQLAIDKARHAAPVEAAQAALAGRQAEQSRRGLVEQLQDAQRALAENTDPARVRDLNRAVRDATDALQNFDDQAQITRLQEQQRAQDQRSEDAATKARAAEDAILDKAERQARLDTAKENKAATQRVAEFERALAALRIADKGNSPAEIQKDIDALERRFGITTDKLGFHHIEDPLISAVKQIKVPTPEVHFTNEITALLQLPQSQLRLLASAIQTNNQPAATTGTRAGGR